MNDAQQKGDLACENTQLRRRIAVLEQELLDAQERCLCDIVAGNGDCWIWEIDAEGRYTRSNETVSKILGYSAEEVIGHYFCEFLHPTVLDALTETSFEIIRAKRSFTGFLSRALHKNGHMVVLESTGFSMLGEEGELLGYRGVDRDITVRKQAAEALQEDEERFHTLVKAIPGIIFVIDEHGRFLEAYGSYPEMFYTDPKEFLGKSIAEVMPSDLAPRLMETVRTVLAAKTVQTIDYSLCLPDRKHFFTSRISPLPCRDGLRRVLALVSDVTLQVDGERSLQEAQEEMERILDAMEEGLVVMDAENRMIRINRKTCELFQYPSEEVIGKPYLFWCHPNFSDRLNQEMKRQKKGERRTYEALYRRKDGSSFWARVAAVPIADGHDLYKGSIGCLSDITEEKRMAAELRRLHEFNEKLIQVAGVWISAVDAEMKITLWNDEAERISGYSRRDVIGHNKIWEWLCPNPEYREAIQQRKQRIELNGKITDRTETTIHTKSGEKRVVSWCASPLRGDKDGTCNGWVIVGVDMTERKRNEQRLQAYAADVTRLNEEKDRFLSTVSHELRTPLAAIRGFADLLVREDDLSAEQQMKIERIRAQAERLNSLLTDLLDISRIEASRSTLTLQEIDLSSIVGKVCDTLRSELDKKEQLLIYSRRPAKVYADPIALEHVLLNLLTNAVAYTPSGGRITIEDHNIDGVVRIDISDNGIGIPPSEQKKIFNEFYRTNEAQRLKGDGTGLGLSIVKRLIEDMSGTIWVRSEGEKKGSTFSFTLPAAVRPCGG